MIFKNSGKISKIGMPVFATQGHMALPKKSPCKSLMKRKRKHYRTFLHKGMSYITSPTGKLMHTAISALKTTIIRCLIN
jgi:hypothetical protein